MKRMQVSGAVVVAVMLAGGMAGAGCATARPVSPVPGSVGDATLSTRVKTALLNEPELGALRIDVNADSGIVTLTGAVRTPEEEQRAMAVARSIEGVRGVQSTLKVELPR